MNGNGYEVNLEEEVMRLRMAVNVLTTEYYRLTIYAEMFKRLAEEHILDNEEAFIEMYKSIAQEFSEKMQKLSEKTESKLQLTDPLSFQEDMEEDSEHEKMIVVWPNEIPEA